MKQSKIPKITKSPKLSSEIKRQSFEFTNHQDDPKKYQNIKKVYSIWVCSNTAQCRANSVDKYSIKRDTILGTNNDHPRYDLFNAVIVNISKNHDTKGSENKMIKVLTDLLNSDLSSSNKIEALKSDGIKVTEEIEEGVEDMCTYTASIRAESEAKGRAEERSLFMEVIDRIKKGDSPEQIIASGVPKEIVDLVMTIRD